jgi:predicted transcriptional regulator of viral defense system
MKWQDLLVKAGNEPVFTAGFLASGTTRLANVRLQLSRWTRAGKLIQFRRGVYSLADPYRKVQPEPFLLANALKPASYVSLQSALAYYGMIPEYVPVVTSVTTGRPEEVDTPLGRFLYRHVKTSWFFGYRQVELTSGQVAFIAQPEKALLDLAYLTTGTASKDYWQQLRLQNLQNLNIEQVADWARQEGGRKLKQVIRHIDFHATREEGEDL